MGLARRLKEASSACRAFALEPLNSPTLSTGYKVGKHRIQGISDDFIPDLLQLSALDGVVSVDDGDAIVAAQMLSRHLEWSRRFFRREFDRRCNGRPAAGETIQS